MTDLINIIWLIMLTVAVGYLCFLAVFGLSRKKRCWVTSSKCDFLVLVPAHNEEAVLGLTLQHLTKLEPTGKLEIAVIADNCEDKTADIARSFGVTVWERTDKDKLGKGYTLAWGLERYNLNDFDAVAIVDADTIVEKHMLKTMASSLSGKAGAIQLAYEFSVSHDTPLARLHNMAGAVENVYFYNGRAALGLPILLRGTGMAIKTAVLKSHPWQSFSLTEDVDYSIDLLKGGITIDFVPESCVSAPAASAFRQAYTQKSRWASGVFGLITGRMIPLAGAGFKKMKLSLVELSFSFLLLSRPLLIYAALVPLVLSFWSSPELRRLFLIWPAALIGTVILYLASGIFLVREKWPAVKALFYAPFYAVWLMMLQIRSFFKRKETTWVRTERKTE